MTLAQIPEIGFFVQNSRIGVKGVRYDLETHLRVIKISELTIVGPLSSEIKSLNRYNLWFIIYKLCENDGFLLKKDGFSYIYVLEL